MIENWYLEPANQPARESIQTPKCNIPYVTSRVQQKLGSRLKVLGQAMDVHQDQFRQLW